MNDTIVELQTMPFQEIRLGEPSWTANVTLHHAPEHTQATYFIEQSSILDVVALFDLLSMELESITACSFHQTRRLIPRTTIVSRCFITSRDTSDR